jgi:FAD-dependent urate hydroxylase
MKPVVVIGAGPYGLSATAHLRGHNVPVRIIGEPLSTWTHHMPAGMVLKSTPPASSISAPQRGHTIQDFCEEMGQQRLESERDVVPIETFVGYGTWFQKRLVPMVEQSRVDSVARANGTFQVGLDSGETVEAAAVVVATGLPNFAYLPPELRAAVPDGPSPDGPVSHTCQHTDLSRFAGRDVVVVGAGQSALETAALLHESGAHARLLVRGSTVRFNKEPTPGRHWQPDTPLGRAWRLVPVARYGAAFRHLPQRSRLYLGRTMLGPAGAWWLKERVAGQIPVMTGTRIIAARVEDGKPVLSTLSRDGTSTELATDHVMAATGYRVDVDRLDFLSPELRGTLSRTAGFPALEAGFQSSAPGLYFTGIPATATFGPIMRFVCGTAFASPRLAAAVAAAHG